MDPGTDRRSGDQQRLGGSVDIELWLTDPGAASEQDRALWLAEWLDESERVRAADARSPARRAEIVVGRAMVRSVLSRYEGRHPSEWRFVTEPGGRPRLEAAQRRGRLETLEFSVTHTRGLLGCAVSTVGTVGADLELEARRVAPLAIAERFFSRGDADAVRASPESERRSRFLERWTLREAYTKALGVPLLELDREVVSFDVGGSGGEGAARLRLPAGVDPSWRFWLLRPTPEHVAAVAWRGALPGSSARALAVRRWSPSTVIS